MSESGLWFESKWLSMILFFMLAFVVLWFRNYRLRQQKVVEKYERQISELEMRTLRYQINPHFLFNCLNSIKNYVQTHETKTAVKYLTDFSGLIRAVLNNSKEPTIPLKSELDMLLLYIRLEKLRFEDKFDFTYRIAPQSEIEKIKIPPLIIQPHVENAIWHGLMQKETKGELILDIFTQGNEVLCVVEDNGIGREAAAELKSKSESNYKSLGLQITQSRIELLNRLYESGIRWEVIDKKDEQGKPLGTKVTMRFPKW